MHMCTHVRMFVCVFVARVVVLLRCVSRCRCAFRLFKFVHRAIRTIAKFDYDGGEVPLRREWGVGAGAAAAYNKIVNASAYKT